MKNLLYLLFLVFFIVSCSKKDPKLVYKIDSENLSLHYDGSHQFEITSSGQVGSTNWNSSDTTVGTIDQAGYFKAKKIGTVTITGSSADYTVKSTVTVIPYSTMCKEPFYNYMQSMAATKNKEFRPLVQETDTQLGYTGENNKVRGVLYAFENDQMQAAALLLSNSSSVVTESYQFFSERYTSLGDEDNVYFFTDNKNLVIGVSIDDTLGFNAIYIDYTLLSENSLKDKKLDEIKKMRINTLRKLKTQYHNSPAIN